MAKLYFLKANIKEQIYEVYKDKKLFQENLNKLFYSINDKLEISLPEDYYYENSDGKKEKGTRFIPYKFFSLEKDDFRKTIIGRLVKHSSINTTEIKDNSIEKINNTNDIPITFYFDVNSEIVIYSMKRYFGHVDFNLAFEKLINKAIEEEEFTFNFEILKNKKDIIQKISTFEKITEMKSEFVPPNPNEDEFHDLFGKKSKYYKEANILKETRIIESGEKGINPKSLEVNRALYASFLGYGNVEITGINKNNELDYFSDKKGMPLTVDAKKSLIETLSFFRENGEKIIAKIVNIRTLTLNELRNIIRKNNNEEIIIEENEE